MATIKNFELAPQKDLDAVAELDAALKSLSGQIFSVAKSCEEISKALGKQSTSTKETQTQIEKLTALEKELLRLQNEEVRLKAKLDPATQELTKKNAGLRNELNKQNQENRQMARLNKATAGSVEELRAKVAVLTKEWANTERGTKSYKTALKDLQKAQKELKKEEGAAGIFGRNVGNYPKMLTSLTGIATRFLSIGAAVGVLKNATKTITDFEQANANLATVLGKSRSEISGLTESAKQLGASTEWSASKVTELQTELAKLGFSEGQIKSMQASILQFATAMGADLAPAAEVAGASLRAFGLDARDIERVTGVMAVGADRSALSFSDFQSSMSTVSPVARSFGFTIEDTVALLGTLSDAGFDASTAATATKNILLNLADANGKLAKQIGGPVKTIPELAKGLEALRDKGVSLSETLELTDVRSVAAFNTFMNGTESLVKLRGELDNTDGALERIQKERLNTVQGSVKLLNSAWESLMLSFSNSTGPVKTAINALTAFINTINRAIDPEGAEFQRAEQAYQTKLKGYVNAIKGAKDNWGALGYAEEEALQKQYEIWDAQTEGFSRQLEESKKQIDYFSDEEKAAYERWLDFQNNKGGPVMLMSEAEYATSEAYHRVLSTYKEIERNYEDHLRAMDEARLQYEGETETTTSTGSGLGKIPTEAELKALKKNQLKMAQDEVKAQQNAANLTVEIRNAANQRILNDSKRSYSERMNALNSYTEDQKQLIKDSADYQIDNLIQGLIDAENNGITTRKQAEKAASQQILFIRKVEANKKEEIDIKSAETSKKITEDYAKEQIKTIEKASTDRANAINKAEEAEYAALVEQYSKGEIKVKEFEEKKTEIFQKYAKQRFGADVELLKEQLNIAELTDEQREKIHQEIIEAEVEYERYLTDIVKEEADKQVEIQEKAAQRRREIIQGIADLALSLSQLNTDKYLKSLDEEEDAANDRHDKEVDRIDRLEKAGAISTEQANARKALSEQKLREEEERIEAERAEAEKKQARLNVLLNTAMAIMTATASAPWPFNLIPIGFAVGQGIIQLAAVEAAKYAEGTPEGGHPGGAAWVGDGGRPEMISYGGKYYKTPAVPTLIDLPKGAEVLPDWDAAIMSMAFNSLANEGRYYDKPVVNVDLSPLIALQEQGNTQVARLARSYNSEKKNQQFYGLLKRTSKYKIN